MCIIVDANSVHDLTKKSQDGIPVLRWLLSGRGGLIVGGKLKVELVRSGFGEIMVNLDRAGRLKKLSDVEVDNTTQKIVEAGGCQSNDCHVLAAAVVSGCRLLFTKDRALHADAKNREILDPPASIYQTRDHEHLLTACDCG